GSATMAVSPLARVAIATPPDPNVGGCVVLGHPRKPRNQCESRLVEAFAGGQECSVDRERVLLSSWSKAWNASKDHTSMPAAGRYRSALSLAQACDPIAARQYRTSATAVSRPRRCHLSPAASPTAELVLIS